MSFLSNLSPLHHNLVASLAPVLYVKAVVGGCDVAVAKKWLPSKISRKVIHVAAGSFILFWPLFTQEHWTWRLNILVPAIYTVQLFVKGAILRNKEDQDVRTMTRTGDPTELLFGPMYFTLVMCTCGLLFFGDETAILIMSCLGFGDGIAPLVGTEYPIVPYPTFPFGAKDKKTLSGSLAFSLSALAGYSVFNYFLLGNTIDWPRLLQITATATVTEGITGKYDNIFVPLVCYFLS